MILDGLDELTAAMSGQEKTRSKAGFFTYRLSSGGGSRPQVPWLVLHTVMHSNGYVKQLRPQSND